MNRERIEEIARAASGAVRYPDPLFPPSLYYRFMRLLAMEVRPGYSVELGVCGGGGSLHLAIGWPGGRVIGVDTANLWPQNVAYVIDRCPNFDFWVMDSIAAAREAKDQGCYPVDILFLDTAHEYDHVWAEFRAWQPLLHPAGAIVLIDDLYRDRMLDAFGEFPGEKVRLDWLHDEAGFGAILYEGMKSE